MKIIIVNYHYFITGGPEVYMFNIMKMLERDGHTVIPFSTININNKETIYSKYFAKNRDGKNETRIENIKLTPKSIYRLLAGAFYNTNARRNLIKLIKDTKPDVIYVLQQVNSLSPSIFNIPKKYKVKIVYRISDFNMICPRFDFLCKNEVCTSCISRKYKVAIKNKCVHNSRIMTLIRVMSMKFHSLFKLYRKIDDYVVPSIFTQEKLIEYNPRIKNRIHLISTFIDYNQIIPKGNYGDYILFSGRLSEEKGVVYLVKAIELVRANNQNVKLLITGDYSSTYGANLIEYVKSKKMENNISFLGFCNRTKMNELLENCLCVACPSIWFDNMPNSIIEAFAYAKPVIASNIGSIKEMVIEGYNGFLFEPKSINQIAKCIMMILEDKEKMIKMGKNARSFCEEKYSPAKHLEALYDVFKSKR